MCLRWVRMVSGPTESLRARSSVVRPSASSNSTSLSRRVSAKRAPGHGSVSAGLAAKRAARLFSASASAVDVMRQRILSELDEVERYNEALDQTGPVVQRLRMELEP